MLEPDDSLDQKESFLLTLYDGPVTIPLHGIADVDGFVERHLRKALAELKKTDLKDSYSSDKVDLISKNELKEIIMKENLLPKSE